MEIHCSSSCINIFSSLWVDTYYKMHHLILPIMKSKLLLLRQYFCVGVQGDEVFY